MVGRPRQFDPTVVLDRAMDVFWTKGYEGTGIADLEAATGLGRQSLYGAFGDKRSLFERSVERYFETVLKPGIIDVLDAPGSGRGNIERVFQIWEQLATQSEFRGCLVGNSTSQLAAKDEEMAKFLGRKLKLLEEAFTRAIRRAQSDGEVNSAHDPKALARSLLAISQGLAIVARVRPSRALVSGVIASARRLLE